MKVVEEDSEIVEEVVEEIREEEEILTEDFEPADDVEKLIGKPLADPHSGYTKLELFHIYRLEMLRLEALLTTSSPKKRAKLKEELRKVRRRIFDLCPDKKEGRCPFYSLTVTRCRYNLERYCRPRVFVKKKA